MGKGYCVLLDLLLIGDNTRLYEANAIPRNELEKYFTAVEQTLHKQYPGEDDAWYGPSPLVLATEALQDYKSRQGPPPLMEGETKVCDSESDSNRDSVEVVTETTVVRMRSMTITMTSTRTRTICPSTRLRGT